MKWLVLLLVVISLSSFAHSLYRQKSYEFRYGDLEISVDLDPHNTLEVSVDGIELGYRENFCQAEGEP